MATYKESVGTAVQNIAGDTGTITGQLWYDSSDSEFKYKYQAYGNAWSTGNDMNTARYALGGAGTQTAGLAFGGESPPGNDFNNTEQYNGTNWTEVNNLTTARAYPAGIGTQTSALSVGGTPDPAINESWNGTNWTEVADLNSGRTGLGGAGVDNTSGLVFGGATPGGRSALVESWNGRIVTGKLL